MLSEVREDCSGPPRENHSGVDMPISGDDAIPRLLNIVGHVCPRNECDCRKCDYDPSKNNAHFLQPTFLPSQHDAARPWAPRRNLS